MQQTRRGQTRATGIVILGGIKSHTSVVSMKHKLLVKFSSWELILLSQFSSLFLLLPGELVGLVLGPGLAEEGLGDGGHGSVRAVGAQGPCVRNPQLGGLVHLGTHPGQGNTALK